MDSKLQKKDLRVFYSSIFFIADKKYLCGQAGINFSPDTNIYISLFLKYIMFLNKYLDSFNLRKFEVIFVYYKVPTFPLGMSW